MAKPLTTTSHALLGLLGLRPWTTYELAKQVQRGLGWFWPRTERKLYDEPKHLVAAGLATATTERVGKRPRTVYAITPKGRRALRAWLDEPSAPPTLEFEAMVRVFFADAGSLDQLRTTLAQVEADATTRVAELRSMIAESVEGTYEFAERLPLNALALRFHLDHQQLLATWAAWAREQTDGWRSPTDPDGWSWQSAVDLPTEG
jgi:DNA-binding PadR family transcriptional regulator